MTATLTRVGLATAAAAIAVSLAGGAYAAGQDTSSPPAPAGRSGRFGGPGGRGGPGGPGGPGGMLQMVLRRLDLTDAQKDRVKAIMDSHRDEIRAIGARAMKAHMALQDAISGDTFDEATVRTRAADVAAVEADAAVAQARGFNEVYQILTPDQQAKLKEIQTTMKQRMASRGPRRGGPGGK